MPIYTFSQGKVGVEDVVYQPTLKDKAQRFESVVLILLPLSNAKPRRPARDKENKATKTSLRTL